MKMTIFTGFFNSGQPENPWRILQIYFLRHRIPKVVFEVNARVALRDAFKMTHRCRGLVIASKIFGQGFGFGRRFDDDE